MKLRDPDLLRTRAFIGGKWLDAANGATHAVVNPATREPLGTVPDMGVAETRRAIEAAGWNVFLLHADDVLAPDCVEAMVARAQEDEQIGLVFSSREIRVEREVGDEGTAWSEHYARLHERFPLYLYLPSRRHPPARVRAFVDFITAECARGLA